MADLSITPSEVFSSPRAPTQKAIAAEAILAGDVIALNGSQGAVRADANGSAPINKAVGIACNSTPGVGQFVLYAADDASFSIGTSAAATQGIPYFLSGNPGKICPAGDLVSGMNSVLVGFGKPSGGFVVKIVNSGVTL